MIYEDGNRLPISRAGSLRTAMQYKHFTDSFNARKSIQKQQVAERHELLTSYLKTSGDRNVLRIATKTDINIHTLRSDLRKMGYHTKGGFIV